MHTAAKRALKFGHLYVTNFLLILWKPSRLSHTIKGHEGRKVEKFADVELEEGNN